jgi:CDP-diacylglycerol--glycerol-3-phosphate 3-phosphatidyltransferase
VQVTPDDLPQRWSRSHHGIDPTQIPLLSGWLRLMWTVARGLAWLRIPPTAVTVSGVGLAVAAVLVAGPLPMLAAALVLLAALCDGLDGALAVVSDRVTRLGAYADAVADRCSDVAFALVLWRCGAAWPLAAAAAVLAVGVDTLRRIRRVPDRITVAERPTFTVCATLAGVSAAAAGRGWPQLICAAVWLAAGCVAVAQLLGTPAGRAPSRA